MLLTTMSTLTPPSRARRRDRADETMASTPVPRAKSRAVGRLARRSWTLQSEAQSEAFVFEATV